jgi:hypothetical protein
MRVEADQETIEGLEALILKDFRGYFQTFKDFLAAPCANAASPLKISA